MGISRFISLTYPEALLLGLALVYLYYRRVANKNVWRLALLVLAILLLCYPAVIHTTKALDLFLLVDRSRSISDEARTKELELIEYASKNLNPGDRLGIVSFNDKAYIEQAPGSEGTIASFQIPYSEDASDLTEGLRTVLNLAKEKSRARVLVLSDGEYTGQNPIREAQIARQKKIPIFYRDLKRAEFFNLSIRDVDLPEKILANEPFSVSFRVFSSVDTPGRYRLYRNGRTVGKGEAEGWRTMNFERGENPIRFTDSLQMTGIHSYRLEVEAAPKDRENILKDNYAERFVKVVGERPILLINNTGGPDNVSRILSAGGLKAHITAIGSFRMGINQLEGYKGIILNNVPILGLTVKQIEALRSFALEEGGGLLICGGNRSFSKGGYYKTAIDPLLPVSLEDRNQSKKVSTAFSIVLDRSGSMAMRTPSGDTKITLATDAVVQCIELMNASDSISVIAVDSAAHIVVDQQAVDDPGWINSEVRTIESMGGGIFVYTGLVAAGSELINAEQLNKHILLFADAADSEEPGKYESLLEEYKKAGITVSVVGLGTDADSDAAFLKDVAKRGEGSIYFTQDAGQLVQFFTADTITYTRNSFVQDAAPMTIRPAAYTISPRQKWKDFACGGYNLMFTRPKAEVAILTSDEDRAPVLAFWQRELGRVAVVALDANGAFAQSANFGDIMLSATRWIMGSNVADNLQIDVNYEGSYVAVKMEVSEQEREKMGVPAVKLFSPSGKTTSLPMHWDSHNRLSADYKLEETGCYRGVIEAGDRAYKIGPMSIPVSPEFLYDRPPDFGKSTLAQMASLTGGARILDIRELFERTQRSTVTEPALLPFLIAFLLLLIAEIAEGRFGLQALLLRSAQAFAARVRGSAVVARLSRIGQPTTRPEGRRYRGPPAGAAGGDAEEPDEATGEAASATGETPGEEMDYLSAAKKRAQRRFGARPVPSEKKRKK